MVLFFMKQPAIYEGAHSSQYSIFDAALSNMNGTCPQHYESSMTWYEVSGPLSQDLTKLMEEEEEIYNTPYEDKRSYGPIYYEPAPSDERKIYAQFEGKRFRKLYHKEIWLAIHIKCLLVVAICISMNNYGCAQANMLTAIGGALGGITFCVIVTSLVLSALYYVICSRKRKSYNISSGSQFSRPNKGMAKYNIHCCK